jgi:hypothetical protein
MAVVLCCIEAADSEDLESNRRSRGYGCQRRWDGGTIGEVEEVLEVLEIVQESCVN